MKTSRVRNIRSNDNKHHAISITRTAQKMLMRRVLSDRYRITQDKFQYHGVEFILRGIGIVFLVL